MKVEAIGLILAHVLKSQDYGWKLGSQHENSAILVRNDEALFFYSPPSNPRDIEVTRSNGTHVSKIASAQLMLNHRLEDWCERLLKYAEEMPFPKPDPRCGVALSNDEQNSLLAEFKAKLAALVGPSAKDDDRLDPTSGQGRRSILTADVPVNGCRVRVEVHADTRVGAVRRWLAATNNPTDVMLKQGPRQEENSLKNPNAKRRYRLGVKVNGEPKLFDQLFIYER